MIRILIYILSKVITLYSFLICRGLSFRILDGGGEKGNIRLPPRDSHVSANYQWKYGDQNEMPNLIAIRFCCSWVTCRLRFSECRLFAWVNVPRFLKSFYRWNSRFQWIIFSQHWFKLSLQPFILIVRFRIVALYFLRIHDRSTRSDNWLAQRNVDRLSLFKLLWLLLDLRWPNILVCRLFINCRKIQILANFCVKCSRFIRLKQKLTICQVLELPL